jgi:hypothetical protein
MENKLFTLLIITGLVHSLQVFSNGNELDKQNQAAIKIQKIARGYLTRKSPEKPGYACMPSYNVARANFIEKPDLQTGDTLHQRRVLDCELPHDLIDYYDNAIVVYRNRINVSRAYCSLEELSQCRPDLFAHVSAKNYLKLPDDFEGPYNRILTKSEYQAILIVALAYSQEHPDQYYQAYDIERVQMSANGKTVY